MRTHLLAVAWMAASLAATPALAGKASPRAPAPPSVSFSGLPASATVTPVNLDGSTHQVTARLVADTDEVAPGSKLRIGLHLTPQKGWKTYWKANIEVGKPTDITWSGPDGVTFSEYAYPIPQRFHDDGDIISFGYQGSVLLFTEVQVPASQPEGTAELTAEATWLTCETQCLPGRAKVTLPVTVKGDAAGEPNKYAPLFDHFAKQHPTSLADAPFTVQAVVSPDPIVPDTRFTATFTVTPKSGKLALPDGPDGIWPAFTPIINAEEWFIDVDDEGKNIMSVKSTADGGVLVELAGMGLGGMGIEQSVIGGLFQLRTADGIVAAEYSQPLVFAGADGGASAGSEADAAIPVATALTLEQLGSADVEPMCDTVVPAKANMGGLAGFGYGLLAAFLGGLLLNIMPCVLPVLTLKLYSLVEQRDISSAKKRMAGLSYTGGIVASFLVLGLVVIGLQLAASGTAQEGTSVSWGFQFQYPGYVAILATVVFVFGLSLFGVFELPAIGSNQAAEASSKEGLVGYFFTGVFATLLATPCSAPFLGSAMGYAFSLPPIGVAAFFMVAGLGLAFPFLLIAFVPAFFKVLPRPGAWMDTFKQLMGFTLMATTVWLVGVLAGMIGLDNTIWFLWFLAGAGMAAWVYGHFGGLGATWQRMLGAFVAAAVVMGVSGYVFLDLTVMDVEKTNKSKLIAWQHFDDLATASILNRYRDGEDLKFEGKPIFMDFTADWCISCKVFERTVLETETVSKAFKDNGVVALKADFTDGDPNLAQWLKCFQTAGVPYYAVVPAGDNRPLIPLGEAISTGSVVDAVERAVAKDEKQAATD